MRNPLSAILQCADGITTSITDYQSAVDKPAIVSEELVQSIYDAAHIITLCTQHQTRIINDVLTLSKLDSAMLMVTPIVVQPTAVVKEILKMFEGELQSQDIEMHFRLEPSYNDTQIDWVFCDPSRLRQVFINILTNVGSGTQYLPYNQADSLLRQSSSHDLKQNEKLRSALVLL